MGSYINLIVTMLKKKITAIIVTVLEKLHVNRNLQRAIKSLQTIFTLLLQFFFMDKTVAIQTYTN